MLAAVLVLAFVGQDLTPERVIPLEGNAHHVQGILVDGSSLYLTSVDRENRKGYLFEYSLATGQRVRAVEIQDGERFHPGGLDASATSLWIPVAEYRRNSSAVIQKRNRKTFALESSFLVKDHIGCVAVAKNQLYAGNWDARLVYEYTFDGREIRKRDNTSQVRFQDMKFRRSRLIASGLTSGPGVVEFLHPDTLASLFRLEFGKTDRGVVYTHEGMDFDGERLYFVPEDAPSRLFIFRIPSR